MAGQQRLRPTLADVAARAGVSTATVSNALNGTGRLTEPTRQKVLAAARSLAYVPASRRQATAHGRVGVIGLTLATYGDAPVRYTEIPYYAEVVLAALTAAADHGYLLVVLPASTSPWLWLTTPLDGVIHLEPRISDRIGGVLRQREIPLVTLGRAPGLPPGEAWVDADVEAGTGALLDHLADAGGRLVGLVLPMHDDAFPEQVLSAYEGWCHINGQPSIVETFEPLTDYVANERDAIARLLSREPRPDAAFGIYTDSGHHLLDAARGRGLSVPDDLLVACVSEDPDYRLTTPPVTTLSLGPRQMGAEAVELLLALVNRRKGFARHRLVQTTLHPRRSTQPTGQP